MTGRRLLSLILLIAAGWSLTVVPWGEDLVHPGGDRLFVAFFAGLGRLDLSPRFLELALRSTWQTITYALAGMTVAIAIGAVLGVVASGTLARRRLSRVGSVVGARGVLGFMRAIHELVWAWLFVVAFGLSPIAGVLAIGIPYGGILGYIYAGHLADVPDQPIRALERAGASPLQLLFYGRLPLAMADIVSYTLYRLECAIRSASVVSFVGLGGLGYQLQLSLDEIQFGQVWTLLLCLLGLVVIVDWWSGEVRRRIAE